MLELVPFSGAQARLARDAYITFGKGQGHKAQLNFGGVMSYTRAKDHDERLAFVDDDFQHTDLETVRLPSSDD